MEQYSFTSSQSLGSQPSKTFERYRPVADSEKRKLEFLESTCLQLKQTKFDIRDCQFPPVPQSVRNKLKEKELLVEERRKASTTALPDKVLDGFALLEAAGVEFPEDGRAADLSFKDFTRVIRQDVLCFEKIESVNAGENYLSVRDFSGLPRLRRLNLACNCIRSLDEGLRPSDFPSLLQLDLSYNLLHSDALENLPFAFSTLKILELNGNGLTELPASISSMHLLEVFSLENNELEGAETMNSLSLMPSLRELYLSHNQFTFLSMEESFPMGESSFPNLDTIDLAFNLLSRQEELRPLIRLPRLSRAMVYGNPLLGPTGEDALQYYLEDTILESDAERSVWGFVRLEFITEFPRKKVVARVNIKNPRVMKGISMGRHAGYRDFSMTMINESKPIKKQQDKRSRTIPLEKVQSIQEEEEEEEEEENEEEKFFLTSVNVEQVVKDVKREWKERIDFVNNITPFSSSHLLEHMDSDTLDDLASNHQLNNPQEDTMSKNSSANGTIPSSLFKRDFSVTSRKQPNKLRSTIHSLRHKLHNPLQADFERESKENYLQETKASISYKGMKQAQQREPVSTKRLEDLASSLDALARKTSETLDANTRKPGRYNKTSRRMSHLILTSK